MSTKIKQPAPTAALFAMLAVLSAEVDEVAIIRPDDGLDQAATLHWGKPRAVLLEAAGLTAATGGREMRTSEDFPAPSAALAEGCFDEYIQGGPTL